MICIRTIFLIFLWLLLSYIWCRVDFFYVKNQNSASSGWNTESSSNDKTFDFYANIWVTVPVSSTLSLTHEYWWEKEHHLYYFMCIHLMIIHYNATLLWHIDPKLPLSKLSYLICFNFKYVIIFLWILWSTCNTIYHLYCRREN